MMEDAIFDTPSQQYAALPWRPLVGRQVEILLVTSRDTGRWVMCKGWPIPGLAPCATAAQEALEEAGVYGDVGTGAIGEYGYIKTMRDAPGIPVQVTVFPLRVRGTYVSWKEDGQRRRRWFSPAAAAALVHEEELSRLLERVQASPEMLVQQRAA